MGACSQCQGKERTSMTLILGSLTQWQNCSQSSWIKLWAHSQVLLNWDRATMPCHRRKEKEKQGCLADFGLRTTCVAHGCFLKVPASTFTMWIYRRWLDFLKEPTPFLEKLQQFRKGESWVLPPSSSCVIWLAHPLRQQELPSLTVPGLGLCLSLVLYWELLSCLNSIEDMKPTAIWQATQTGANFCSLLIYLPVALLITACSGDAERVCLELGWCWLMGSSSVIGLVTPAHSRHSCWAVTWTDPRAKASLGYCIPESERSLGGVFTAGTALAALTGTGLAGLTCRNPSISFQAKQGSRSAGNDGVLWHTLCGAASGRNAVNCDD